MSENRKLEGGTIPGASQNEANQSVVTLSFLVLRNFRFLIIFTILGTLVVTVGSFFLPNLYLSEARIIPQSKLNNGSNLSLPSGIQGFSSIMGMNLGGPSQDTSRLFGEILHSTSFAQGILLQEYFNSDSTRISLASVLNPEFSGEELQLELLTGEFKRKILKTRFIEKSGVSTLGVELDDSFLAWQVAKACLERLDRDYQNLVRSQNQDFVLFLDGRLEEANRNLEIAEITLRDFLIKNSMIEGAVDLQFQKAGLQRNLEIKTQIYLNLYSQVEMARMELSRNTPSIVVLDPPVRPILKSKPRRAIIGVVALIISFSLGIVILLIWEGHRRFRTFHNQLFSSTGKL